MTVHFSENRILEEFLNVMEIWLEDSYKPYLDWSDGLQVAEIAVAVVVAVVSADSSSKTTLIFDWI